MILITQELYAYLPFEFCNFARYNELEWLKQNGIHIKCISLLYVFAEENTLLDLTMSLLWLMVWEKSETFYFVVYFQLTTLWLEKTFPPLNMKQWMGSKDTHYRCTQWIRKSMLNGMMKIMYHCVKNENFLSIKTIDWMLYTVL